MSCSFDSLGYFPLKLQAGAGKPSWKDLALLIDKLQQEVGIFIINILDAVLLEPAVFFAVLGSVYGFVYQCHAFSSCFSADFLKSPFLRFLLYSRACLSRLMVKKRITLSSLLNSISRVFTISVLALYSKRL